MRNSWALFRLIVVAVCVVARAATGAAADVNDVPLFPTRQPAFDIPFQIDEPIPGQEPVEVQLHVSADQGATWQVASKIAPNAGRFSFRAPQDGEYWFLVRTLNKQGRLLPEKLFSPEMRVLVDSEPPRLEVTCNRGTAGEVYCVWKTTDPHLKADTLKLTYQGIDGGSQWQNVAVAPTTQADGGEWNGRTTFVPTGVKWPLFVRVEVSDIAGNLATAQIQVDALPGAGPQSLPLASSMGNPPGPFANSPRSSALAAGDGWRPEASSSSNYTSQPPGGFSPSSTAPNITGSSFGPSAAAQAGDAGRPPSMSASFPGRATPPLQSEAVPKTSSATPQPGTTQPGAVYSPSRHELIPAPQAAESVPPPATADAASPYRRTSDPRDPASSSPSIDSAELLPTPGSASSPTNLDQGTLPGPQLDAPALGPSLSPSVIAAPTDATPREVRKPAFDEPTPPGVNPKMVNSRRFELEYDVESIGSSGVAKVELWLTRDAGRTWTMSGVDDDGMSPYVVNVDEEGVYGFRMVIETTTGLRSPTPEPGDLPEVWVGVDVTKPTARITSMQQRGDEAGGMLDIRWEADDRLLSNRPISLSFSEKSEGPWTTIVTGLPNTHSYDWRFDGRTPEKIYLKLEVRDVAGNTAVYVTPSPVVIERIRPQGRIRGVRPLGESARLKTPSQILPR